MRKLKIIALAVLFLIAGTIQSQAEVGLFDWGFNLDGTLYVPTDTLPSSVDDTGFDWTTGLGLIDIFFLTPGLHSAIAFFDHEIDEGTNTYFNEYGGTATGAPDTNQTWEIDEPGWVYGDIFTNLTNGTLDNSNGVPITAPDDVSMAMGFELTVPDNYTGIVRFNVSDAQPNTGFYMAQTDPDSSKTIYFSGDQAIRPSDQSGQVPEPATMLLFGTGLAGLAGWKRKRGKA